jgi:hypothetical protein
MDTQLLIPITVLHYQADTLGELQCTQLQVPTENGRAILTAEFRQNKLIVAVLQGHVTPLPANAEARAITILYYDKDVMTIVETAQIEAQPPQLSPLRDPAVMRKKMLIAAFAGQVTVLNKTGERWGTPEQMAAVGEAA